VDDYFDPSTGMKSVDAKLVEFNREGKWVDYHLTQRINEHLSRMHALYDGGDCYIAGFAGARPNDRIWTLGKHVKDNVFWNVYVSLEVLMERARVKHERRHGRIGIIPANCVR